MQHDESNESTSSTNSERHTGVMGAQAGTSIDDQVDPNSKGRTMDDLEISASSGGAAGGSSIGMTPEVHGDRTSVGSSGGGVIDAESNATPATTQVDNTGVSGDAGGGGGGGLNIDAMPEQTSRDDADKVTKRDNNLKAD